MPLIRLTNTCKDRETRMDRRLSAAHPSSRLKLNNIFLRPGHSVDLPISVLLPQLPGLTEHEKGKRIRLTDAESGEELSIAKLLAQHAPKVEEVIPEEVLEDTLSLEEEEPVVEKGEGTTAPPIPEPEPEALVEEVLPPLEVTLSEVEALPSIKEDLATLLGKKQAELADMCRERDLPVKATDNKTSLAKRLLGQET